MLWFHMHSDGHWSVSAQDNGSLDVSLFSCDGNSKRNWWELQGRNKENMEHSSASVRKCVAPQAGVLAGSGPPAPESTAELGKAGADWLAWQGGKGRRKQGSQVSSGLESWTAMSYPVSFWIETRGHWQGVSSPGRKGNAFFFHIICN